MRINTERLILRPLQLTDLNTTHAYASDVDNTRYMIHLPNHTLQETARFLGWAEAGWQQQPQTCYEFAVMKADTHIGAVSLSVEAQAGELGWILARPYWGQGYALEAATALRDMAFDRLHLGRLIAHCDSRNTASERLMQKLGMRLVSAEGERTYPDHRGTARELCYALERAAGVPR